VHELAHIQLRHPPARVEVSETGLLLLSDYFDEQEQEVDWLGAALLLPSEGLVQLRSVHPFGDSPTIAVQRMSKWGSLGHHTPLHRLSLLFQVGSYTNNHLFCWNMDYVKWIG